MLCVNAKTFLVLLNTLADVSQDDFTFDVLAGQFFGEDIFIGGYFYSTDNFTIIGHEPKLNDVLQWLKIKCIKISRL